MDQAFGPIAAAAAAPWHRLLLGLSITLAMSVAMWAMTFAAGSRSARREPIYVASRPKRPPHPDVPEPAAPVYTQEGFRQLEDARRAAEDRAAAAERNYRALQADFKTMLENLKAAEAALATHTSSAERAQQEAEALRAQVRDSAKRIGVLEQEGNAMRQRLKLRERELGMAQARADEAERRAKDAERELERTVIELQSLESRFRMSKLSEALRDLDEIVVPDADGGTEGPPPRVIYSASDEGERVVPAAKEAR
jgi:hypothetical protein